MAKDKDDQLIQIAEMAANDLEAAEDAAKHAKIGYRALAEALKEKKIKGGK